VTTNETTDGLERWFVARGWTPFDYQRRVWDAHRARESGLVQVPTGLGKTMAAIGGVVREALEDGDVGGGLRVLWITPLRALARDTVRSLDQLFEEVGLGWRVELRTGDTGSGPRKRQRTDPPEVLVTTPESLGVLLSFAERDDLFAYLDAVIVDEWHELLGSKRGVMLELELVHLRARRPGLVLRALSATLGNPEVALEVLMGPGGSEGVQGRPQGRIDTGPPAGEIEIDILLPPDVLRFPWAGHIGLALLDQVLAALESAESALVFTNTRAQAEIWHRAILEARPAWSDRIALHHGSISRADRRAAEEGIADGTLKAVVCTSSLDLGVDFQPVERVFQIGSPKGIGRLLQRAGRSGHRPGATRRLVGVPAHAFEIAEFVAARRAVQSGNVEPRTPVRGALDVLAQHVVTLTVGGPVEAEALYREARATHAFAGLERDDWTRVLDFVTRGGDALGAYDRYHRVALDGDGILRPARERLGRDHRPTIGTITDDGAVEVRFMKGGRLGTIEESFLGRLSPGDSFLFAGRELELVRLRDMRAYVRLARKKGGPVPRWAGGRLPLSSHLADAVAGVLEEARIPEPEARTLDALLEVQDRWSSRPGRSHLLIEHTRSREGDHAFLYPFLGRLAHEGLAMLLAWRWTQDSPRTVHVSMNDYGIELLSDGGLPPDEAAWRHLLRRGDLENDLVKAMNAGELARRRFREIARVAGLVHVGPPGRQKSARNLQASAGLVFDVLERYDPGNVFLGQARREALDAELEIDRIARGLDAIAGRPFRFRAPERLTPLAFPIWAERIQAQASSESWLDRVRREAERLETAASRGVPA
jgi:ATP-dependent Lhr-like helicase